ncbi:trypsin-like serine protease [Maritimibacter sp. UBA3975]|uniref:trypsin-like serine peptidase n=1 Tax=Maritimibacter sp. UBA3975 TaxID=1946833 RepID=UPI000C09E664|nr:trypsin-like serine protease [Maritimibacter sp. UBA3975]MAM63959.1 trypsin [Maritimibacter sp.]|tara:strand:- start:3732 stop:4559 length:828 start_codon:yes stop_codon:yes gene_type:complete
MIRLIAALLALAATPAVAEPSELRALMTANDSKGWEAVGRLNIAGEAFCTGALISETIVLTAAHCVYDSDTGEQYPANSIDFLAGWRNGRAVAYRGVRRLVVHEDYDFNGEDNTRRVASDIALLELDQPIRKSNVSPFPVGEWPRKGDEVGVVSYARDREDMPSLQETCKVLGRQGGSLVMNCDVDHGASGAPIFMIQWNRPVVVSVVSAKAHAGDLPVSLGTSLGDEIDALKIALANSDGIFTHVAAPVPASTPKVVRRDSGAASTAKFLRPAD